MVLGRCPFCHRFFAAEPVSREETSSEIISDPRAPKEPARTAGRKYGPTDYVEQDFIATKTHYRCRHCGKEWTKKSTEDVDIPREYTVEGKD